MNDAPRPLHSRLQIALFGSLGALLSSAGGLLIALQFQSQRFQSVSPWRMLKFLAVITTPLQALELGAWAVITGILIATGSREGLVNRAHLSAAFVAGALVPMGLVSLGHLLNSVWPNTTGPGDAPIMAPLLALYSLGVPWVLGRLIVRWVPAYGVAIDTHKTISP